MLSARRMTLSQFHNEDRHIGGTTMQDFIAWVPWHLDLGNVYIGVGMFNEYWGKYLDYFCTVLFDIFHSLHYPVSQCLFSTIHPSSNFSLWYMQKCNFWKFKLVCLLCGIPCVVVYIYIYILCPVLRNPKFNYHDHASPSLVPILNRKYPFSRPSVTFLWDRF